MVSQQSARPKALTGRGRNNPGRRRERCNTAGLDATSGCPRRFQAPGRCKHLQRNRAIPGRKVKRTNGLRTTPMAEAAGPEITHLEDKRYLENRAAIPGIGGKKGSSKHQSASEPRAACSASCNEETPRCAAKVCMIGIRKIKPITSMPSTKPREVLSPPTHQSVQSDRY